MLFVIVISGIAHEVAKQSAVSDERICLVLGLLLNLEAPCGFIHEVLETRNRIGI